MYNKNISSLNVGGGNSFNIIRMPSYEQWTNIVQSDMNGTIDNSSTNRAQIWNYFISGWGMLKDHTTTQTNTRDICLTNTNHKYHDSDFFQYINKNSSSGAISNNVDYYTSSFRPIIEC